ncbi:uncharacterized protein NPIL_178961 [Nephila pilipes]|uniref:Mutator-like transposase domain-containing protein n=1 Tax=Nephila pilipes TaxID=299642 RepID=A0A8X6ND53_NEPPI|nr:uncharacterized protein NPIL_178961 [Nephila pilipes]
MQESVCGLAMNMTLKCENCDYSFSFCSSDKINKLHNINLAFVFGMRVIGKGYSAAKKLCSAININVPSKTAFGFLEKKLEVAASYVACNTMNEAALEIRGNENDSELSQCGVTVDGTWQRRGYSSLNGCVSVISIDTGKVLDIEFMSKGKLMVNLCEEDHQHFQKGLVDQSVSSWHSSFYNSVHTCPSDLGPETLDPSKQTPN